MHARHYHQRSDRMVQRAVRELDEIATLTSYRATDTHGRELWRRSTPPKLRFVVRGQVVIWIGSSAPPADVWTPPPADVVVPLQRGLQTRPSRMQQQPIQIQIPLIVRSRLRDRFGARMTDALMDELRRSARHVPTETLDRALDMLLARGAAVIEPIRYLRALLRAPTPTDDTTKGSDQ